MDVQLEADTQSNDHPPVLLGEQLWVEHGWGLGGRHVAAILVAVCMASAVIGLSGWGAVDAPAQLLAQSSLTQH